MSYLSHQNESHPYLHEKDLRDYCRLHGIAFQVTRSQINISIINPYHQHQQKHDQAYSALGSADRPWALQGSITSGVPKTGHEVATKILIILSKLGTGMKSDRCAIIVMILFCPGFEASGDCQDCFQTWQKHCQRRHQMASPGV